jgi:hypothetical protein
MRLEMLWEFGQTESKRIRLANWLDSKVGIGVNGIRIAIRRNDRPVALSDWKDLVATIPVTIVFYRKSIQDFMFTLTIPKEDSNLGGRLLMSGVGIGENINEMLQLSEILCTFLEPDQAAVFLDPNCYTRWDGTGERYPNLRVSKNYFTHFLRDRGAIAYWISDSFGFSPGNYDWLKVEAHKGGLWLEVSEAHAAKLEELVSQIGAWANDAGQYLQK